MNPFISSRLFLAMISILAASMPAWGQGGVPGYPDSITAYDPREVAALPAYCIHTQYFRDRVREGKDPARIAYWESTMGTSLQRGYPIFNSMHHYCWALMKTLRANLARSQSIRMNYLNDAIGEFDYVIERAPEDFVLMPEILTRKGETLIRLGRAQLGIIELTRAMALKPDYWPPYAQASDYYKDSGDSKKAREILELGLKHSPDASALLGRMAELDSGKRGPKSAAPSAKSRPPVQTPAEK